MVNTYKESLAQEEFGNLSVEEILSPALYKDYKEPYIELLENIYAPCAKYHGEIYSSVRDAVEAREFDINAERVFFHAFRDVFLGSTFNESIFMYLPRESFHPHPEQLTGGIANYDFPSVNELKDDLMDYWKGLISRFLNQIKFFRDSSETLDPQDANLFLEIEEMAVKCAYRKILNYTADYLLEVVKSGETELKNTLRIYDLFEEHVIQNREFTADIEEIIEDSEIAELPYYESKKHTHSNLESRLISLIQNLSIKNGEIEEVSRKRDVYRVVDPMHDDSTDWSNREAAEGHVEDIVDTASVIVRSLHMQMGDIGDLPESEKAKKVWVADNQHILYLRRNFEQSPLLNVLDRFYMLVESKNDELWGSKNPTDAFSEGTDIPIYHKQEDRAKRRFAVELYELLKENEGILSLELAAKMVDTESILEEEMTGLGNILNSA